MYRATVTFTSCSAATFHRCFVSVSVLLLLHALRITLITALKPPHYVVYAYYSTPCHTQLTYTTRGRQLSEVMWAVPRADDTAEEGEMLRVICAGPLSGMAERTAADDCEADGDPRVAVL